eukprot:1060924-Pyramimonas_sp.AAC.1
MGVPPARAAHLAVVAHLAGVCLGSRWLSIVGLVYAETGELLMIYVVGGRVGVSETAVLWGAA